MRFVMMVPPYAPSPASHFIARNRANSFEGEAARPADFSLALRRAFPGFGAPLIARAVRGEMNRPGGTRERRCLGANRRGA